MAEALNQIQELDGAGLPPTSDTSGAGGDRADSSPAAAPPTVRESIEAARKSVAKDEARIESPAESRVRDPATGQFARQEQKPAAAGGPKVSAESAPEAAAAPKPLVTQTEAKPDTTASTPSGPPNGWSQEAKASWASLSPAIQAAVIKREQEVSNGFAQYGQIAQRHKEFEQIVTPRRQYYAGQGISDTEAVNNLWLWFEALQNSPAKAFPELAQRFGIDLSTVIPGAQANADQSSYIDPVVQSLQEEIRQLRGQMGQVTGTFQQQAQERTRQELANFAKDKPHFETVRVNMGRLMQAGMANSLDEAYQQALALNPEVQAQIQRDQQAEAAKKAAETALTTRPPTQRQAAVSLRGGAPSGANGANKAPVGSIREELNKAFAQHRA